MTPPLWQQIQDADCGIAKGFIVFVREFEEKGIRPSPKDCDVLLRRLRERGEPTLALAVSRLLGGPQMAP